MDAYVSRGISARFCDALSDTPVLVVQGPRQSGKSTFVQRASDLPYVTLDDSLALSSAMTNPDGWLKAFVQGAVIDEVQRAPHLMRSIKKLVDNDRRPGRFVLTGSANVLLIPKLSDSLAGRMEVFTLFPLSQSEIAGQPQTFVDRWLAGDLSAGPVREVESGGFPEPIARPDGQRRNAWFQSYIRALMDRDVRDLAQIDGLHSLPNLLAVLARTPFGVQNVTQLSRDTGIPATSLSRYLSLLQAVYLIHPVPAWTALHGGKSAKTARLAFVDTGVWRHLSGRPMDSDAWAQFVAMELVKEAGWATQSYEVRHFRSTRHHSVPIVLDLGDGRILGVSVLAHGDPSPSDFEALKFLREVSDGALTHGVVLHQGQSSGFVDEWLGYTPVTSLWPR